MSYRGNDMPEELKNVLQWWIDGKAFLGGEASTGKSIFKLTDDFRMFSFELTEENTMPAYIENYGWRGCLTNPAKDINQLINILIKSTYPCPHIRNIIN